jgi:hypothetical protein
VLALVIVVLWAIGADTVFTAVVIIAGGSAALVAAAMRLTPRWGKPSACSIRSSLAAIGLVVIAAAPVTEHDSIGALLLGFGDAVSVLQIAAAAGGAAIGVRVIRRTVRAERAGEGQTC